MKFEIGPIVKDESKICSIVEKENEVTVLLKNGVKLGNVFSALPYGIINKTETGIGATTLELQSPRNSIIVQPLKVTASSKAKKHDALYVGSSTNHHATKSKKGDIKKYHDDASIKHKKIVVVADSLDKVINEIGEGVYDEYFMMLDEVDCFQKDSTYRNNMEKCIDLYKKFDKKNRALVSATILPFTDPELHIEQKVNLGYENPEKKKLEVIYTDKEEETCYEELINLLKTSEHKILVAYNSVDGCKAIAETLVKNGVLHEKEIKILCSKRKSNQDKLGEYFGELLTDKLPQKLNFITSAYFNGCDIDEEFHLINLSVSSQRFSRLSEIDIKQITGRCRRELISNKLITKIINEVDSDIYTEEQYLEAANSELDAIRCVESNFKNNPILKLRTLQLRKEFSDGIGQTGFKFIRYNVASKYEISYFNIDAALEDQRVENNLYTHHKKLNEALENVGFTVTETSKLITTKHITSSSKSVIDVAEISKKAIENIEKFPHLIQIILQDRSNLHKRESEIYLTYINYKHRLENKSFIDRLRIFSAKKNSREFNKFKIATNLFCLEESSLIKTAIKRHFPIGVRLFPYEIYDKIISVCSEASLHLSTTSSRKSINEIVSPWVELKNCKLTDETGKVVNGKVVVGYNPYKFVLSTKS